MSLRQTLGAFAISTLSACSDCGPRAEKLPEDPSKGEVVSRQEDFGSELRKTVEKQPTPEELALEARQQNAYNEEFASDFPGLFGSKLYTNEELLDSNFKAEGVYSTSMPNLRLLQFFLRNGREATFGAAENLGAKHRRTELTHDHILTQLFRDAGIDVEGEMIDWLEVDSEIKSGGTFRDGERYGGGDEIILMVARHVDGLDPWIEVSAQDAGYRVDPQREQDSTIVNEMSHEIQNKYFAKLFLVKDEDLTKPFVSFRSEIPGLRFRNNAQAAEFLSDVASWSLNGGSYFRFFNPLGYMNPTSEYYRGAEGSYAYSYAVQKYAMERVLREKGYKNAKSIIENLISASENSELDSQPQYTLARKYFTEEDFIKIGEIYRRIGVALLKEMAPFFKKPLSEKPASE